MKVNDRVEVTAGEHKGQTGVLEIFAPGYSASIRLPGVGKRIGGMLHVHPFHIKVIGGVHKPGVKDGSLSK